MHIRWIICAILLITALMTAGGAAVALAERAPEDRGKATHVIVGTVAGVYMREDQDTRHYLVEIAIEKVEKGDGFKPGGTFYVGCYLWTPDYYKGKVLTEAQQKELALRGPAYDGVPKEGERIRVYAKHLTAFYKSSRAGKYDGVYPSWYDVVKSEAK